MRTILQWFNELPEPYRTEAIDNVRAINEDGLSFETNKLSRAIDTSFTWANTPQGHAYWSGLCTRYALAEDAADAEMREIEREERKRLELERREKMVTFSSSMNDMLVELANYSEVANRMLNNSDKDLFCNYVTMRGEMCSYLPKGKSHIVTDSGRWAREGRQEIKPAKLARKIISSDDNLTDKDFETFNNMVRAFIGINGDEDGEGKTLSVEVVSGEDIRKAYLEDNYSNLADSGSNLWGSCMRYDKCQDYFDIYVDNNVKLLIAKDVFGKIVGRALLWECINGRKAMDTIYSPENVRQVFINWAIENKHYYKSSQSCHHHYFDMFDGDRCDCWDADVQLACATFDEYPYMDSLRFLNEDNKILSNNDSIDWTHCLRDTGGGYESNRQTVYDEYDEEDIDEEDSVFLDYRTDEVSWCGTTHTDNTTRVEDGYRVLDDHAMEVDGRHYVQGSDLIVYVESHGEYYRRCDTVETYDGDIIHEDDAVECAHTGNTYYEGDMKEVSDGVFVHYDSVEDYLEQLKENENV
jgi:hypothetical protein